MSTNKPNIVKQSSTITHDQMDESDKITTTCSTLVDGMVGGDDDSESVTTLPSTTNGRDEHDLDPTPLKRRCINYQLSTTIDEEETKQLQLMHPTTERPIIPITMTVTVNMDDDEPMKEVMSAKSDVSMNQVNTSLIQYLTFDAVMVEPCLMRMLEFISIRDRIRFICVSHLWADMVRLRRLWSNIRLSLPQLASCDIGRLPRWLRNSISRLNIGLDASRIMIFQQLPRIQYLYLYQEDTDLNHGVFRIDVQLFRSALQSIQLVSFRCHDLTPQVMRCLFATSCDESHPPPIQRWSNTLTYLGVESDHDESMHSTLVGISQHVWPRLSSLYLRLVGNITTSIPVLTSMLARTSFPTLQCLNFVSHNVSGPTHHIDLSEQTPLLDQLFASLQRELNQLTTLTTYVAWSPNMEDVQLKYYQVCHLSSSLTSLTLRFNDRHIYPYVGSLQHLQTLSLTCSQLGPLILSHQFLTAVGHHNLPKLDTLRIKSTEADEDSNITDSGQHGDDIIRMIKAMVNLTSLDITLDWYRSDIRSHWLESIHHFPNLKKLRCWIEDASLVGLYASIGIASARVEIVRLNIPPTYLGHIVQEWSHCSSNLLSSISPSQPIPIRRFSVSMPNEHSHGFSADHIMQFQCLSQLTNLTLRGPFQPNSSAVKILADLPQLKILWLYAESYEMDLFVYWCQPSPPVRRFPQLTTLLLHTMKNGDWFNQNGLSPMLLIELLVRIPHLHTLTITGLNQSQDIAAVRAFVQQTNQLGRQPQLEVNGSDDLL